VSQRPNEVLVTVRVGPRFRFLIRSVFVNNFFGSGSGLIEVGLEVGAGRWLVARGVLVALMGEAVR
jgi:hypothetical protein